MFDLRSLKIYIDGACPGNVGGPGGFAVWLEFPFDRNKADEFLESRGYFNTTNNRMELRACLFAHEWILDQGIDIGVQHVQIATDSKYVHENYNRAIGWSQNDWRNLYERTIGNGDVWKALLRARRKIGGRPRLEIIKIPRCCSQIAKNVDRDARLAARSPTHTDSGFKPGKIGRARNNDKRAAQPYPACGDKVIVYVYRTQVAGRGVQTVRFQTYSEERRDFFEKFWAQAEDAIGNSLHRGNAFLVRMNNTPENPRIVEILAALEKSDLLRQPGSIA